MAQNELDFQAELVKAARAQGGFGFKCAHMNLVGISDLSIKMPGMPHQYVECKWVKKPKVRVTTELSTHQADFLKEYLEAGGHGCWIVGYAVKKPLLWGCFVLRPTLTRVALQSDSFDVTESFGHFTRSRGETWDMRKIMQYAHKLCA